LGLLGKKARRDLLGNRRRIMTALFAMVLGTVVWGAFMFVREMINREIDAEYAAIVPASATIVVDRADENLLALLDRFEDISGYEVGAAHELAMYRTDGKLKKVWLFSSPNYAQRKINIVTSLEGSFAPASGEVLLDSDALGVAGAKMGDCITIRRSDGTTRPYKITGLVNDLSQHPPSIHDNVYVYVSPETLDEMNLSMNRVDYIVTGDMYDRTRIWEVSQALIQTLDDSGYPVSAIQVSNTPGISMHAEEYKGLLFIVQVFSVAAFLFGCIIMSSLFSTILAGQSKQIGILKSIGAKTQNITRAYLGAAMLLIACNLAVSFPLSCLAARGLSIFFMSIGNMKIHNFSIPIGLYILFCAAGIVIPFLLASMPIRRGLKVTVKEAVNGLGTGARLVKKNAIASLLKNKISRPVLLSLRGAMENRRRFSMNVAMLTLGGLMFVGVMGTVISINMAVLKSVGARHFDYQVMTGLYAQEETIARAIDGHENIADYEIWGAASGQIVYDNGNIGGTFGFSAVPADTALYKPDVIAGRWLEPGDTNAVVVSFEFFEDEPDFALGDHLSFRVGGAAHEFKIVGILKEIGDSSVYVNKDGFEQLVPEQARRSSINISTHYTGGRRTAMYNSIMESISDSGIPILHAVTRSDNQKIVSSHFSTTLQSFLVVAILSVIVAGIGLATTMSVQVNERACEIGILKAIGANSKQVFSIITAESNFTCLFSFGICLALGIPFTLLATQVIGVSILQIPLAFSPFVIVAALGIWLVVTFIVGRLASGKAAKRAAGMTVKKALAVEP